MAAARIIGAAAAPLPMMMSSPPVPIAETAATAARPAVCGLAPVRRLVVLCADWCGTCRGYQAVMEAVAARFPGWRATWIDIEDQAELVDELDVETFPTVLLYEQAASGAAADRLFFFGPMLPHEGTLQRQVEQAEALASGQQALPPLPGELGILAAWLRQGAG